MTVYNASEREIAFADESSFNEQLQTFDHLIPVVDARPGWKSGRADDKSIQARRAQSRPGYLMPRSDGTFEIDFYLGGAGADVATGALPTPWHYKLLADALGGSDATQVGGVAGAGATATSIAAATGTRVRGGVVRVGIGGDAKGNGQATVIGNPDTALLVALDGSPGATDVIRPCAMVFPKETIGATKRFLLGFSNQAGMQYVFSGCACQAVTLKITHGDLILVTMQYRYAYWREISGYTVPSSMTLEDCKPHISSGGSYFLNTVGTATRTLEEASEIEIAISMPLANRLGQGGLSLQPIIGWSPLPFSATLKLTIPWSNAKALEYDKDASDSVEKHFLATFSAGDGNAEGEGRHVTLYGPRLYPIGERPSATPWNGLQYQTAMYQFREGPDTTSDLSRSALRIGLS